MKIFILKRILQTIVAIFFVSMITFLLLSIAADPAQILAGPEASKEDIEIIRQEMGLNKPIYIQYFLWLRRAMNGDLGKSFTTGLPALYLIYKRFPATMILAIFSLAIGICISMPLGIIAAVKKHSFIDNFAIATAVFGQSMPSFWFGIILMIIFAVKLRLLPVSGQETFFHLILPGICLGYYISPVLTRLIRSGMLDELQKDYVVAARAKGLSKTRVVLKHVLRNAIRSFIAIIGVQAGRLIGGSIIIETVFDYKGLGLLLIESIWVGDYPVVQAALLIMALVFVVTLLISDIFVAILNPKAREQIIS
jgi:peptide/nickel transport system permease protein